MTSVKSNNNSFPAYASVLLWICRLIAGGAFIVSGWSKSIDPWGFIYKIEEYLSVWSINEPRELILCAAIALSAFEFITGVCLLCGMLRRMALWSAAAVMAFMLPLTIYIAVADPVADCGCFGDFIIVSNTATLLKNIVICAAIAGLFYLGNKHGAWLFRPATQWIAITLTSAYILTLALYGYNVQPLVDFRIYPVGTDLAAALASPDGSDDADGISFVYSKNGVQQSFSIDNLPDSSWEFVRRENNIAPSGTSGFGIYDASGDDLGSELITHDGTLMLVVVADPGLHYLSRSRFVNEVAATVKAGGGETIGLVGAPWQTVEEWADLSLPDFDVYSADDTELKSLVRGDAALVLLDKGRIIWKRTVNSLDADFTSVHSTLKRNLGMPSPDNGRLFRLLSVSYLILMLL
ncbi:MAG: DoxX family protein, partial [Muribaculaceae bacterium]|nr:DoxX family protein [Muribaculaceae bacterium]